MSKVQWKTVGGYFVRDCDMLNVCGRAIVLKPIYSIREVQQSTAIALVNEEVTAHFIWFPNVAWIWKRIWSQGFEFTLLMWWGVFERTLAIDFCLQSRSEEIMIHPVTLAIIHGDSQMESKYSFSTFLISTAKAYYEKQKATVFAGN